MADVHEDACQLKGSGGISWHGHKLGLQFGNVLPSRRALGQGRLHLHVGPRHKDRHRKKHQNSQIKNASYHGLLHVPQTRHPVQPAEETPRQPQKVVALAGVLAPTTTHPSRCTPEKRIAI
jgi:hypothetical protein